MSVDDPQAFKKMDVTRERIIRILVIERNTPVIQNWFQPCQCFCCLCCPGEYLRLGTIISLTEPRSLKLVIVSSLRLIKINGKKLEKKQQNEPDIIKIIASETASCHVLKHACDR